jgi:DNA polymerase III alpha subunit
MVVGVEVQAVREFKVKKEGKNQGRPMAYLSVGDETGVLDDVTVFPDAWDKFGDLLAREKTVVAISGRKNDTGSFSAEEVWPI